MFLIKYALLVAGPALIWYFVLKLAGPLGAYYASLSPLLVLATLRGDDDLAHIASAIIFMISMLFLARKPQSDTIYDVVRGLTPPVLSAAFVGAAVSSTVIAILGGGDMLQFTAAFQGGIGGLIAGQISYRKPARLAAATLAGIPIIGIAAVVVGARTPLYVKCKGVTIGRLEALLIDSSETRAAEVYPKLRCVVSEATISARLRRILIVGGLPRHIIPRPYLVVKISRGDYALEKASSRIEEALSIVSRDGYAITSIAAPHPSIARALASLLSRASTRVRALVIDACSPHSEPIGIEIVRSLGESINLVVLRLCKAPREDVDDEFTSAYAARIACPPLERNQLSWAASLVGSNDPLIAGRIISKGMCISDKICVGLPGVFIPRRGQG